MNRRIFRTVSQLTGLVLVVVFLVVLLDSRIRLLPASIHNHLPTHNPGFLVTDVTITTCSQINIFSSCNLDPKVWERVEKDLYLGQGWATTKAYIHLQRKKNEDLLPTDKIVVDLKMGRLDPGAGTDHKWESRPGGIWLMRSSSQRTADSQKPITSINVLFGPDAVDPRPNWEIKDLPLILDSQSEARLTIRRGTSGKIERPTPRIRKDGKFKIMQAADLHLGTGLGHCREPIPAIEDESECDADPRTLEFIEKLLEEEKPDLVVLTGDQVNGETAPDAQTAIFKFADIFIRHEIPYAAIFGNHDDDGDLDRTSLMAVMEQLPYSLSQAGPENIDGIGNYLVEVLGKSSSSALTLYFLDTHKGTFDEKNYPGYGWLKENQVDWFKTTSRGLQKAHKQYTHIHMDLAFIHVPLPEYRNADNYWRGNWTEAPTSPAYNSGFRDALVGENVVLVSCGHDHVNDYCMLEKNSEGQPALWMCYGGGVGFGGYGGHNEYVRRLRFFDIDMNEARIRSYKRLEWGDTESRLDDMILVDGGRVVGP